MRMTIIESSNVWIQPMTFCIRSLVNSTSLRTLRLSIFVEDHEKMSDS